MYATSFFVCGWFDLRLAQIPQLAIVEPQDSEGRHVQITESTLTFATLLINLTAMLRNGDQVFLAWVLLLVASSRAQLYHEAGPCAVLRTSVMVELPEESECGSECTLDVQVHLPDPSSHAAEGLETLAVPGSCPPPPWPLVIFYSGFQVHACAQSDAPHFSRPAHARPPP